MGLVLLLRAALSSCLIFVFTLLGALLALAVRLVTRSSDLVIALVRVWAWAVLAVAGVKVTVENKTALNPAGPYVFMANHVSSVDIWALYVAIPVRIRMLAKKQLARIPFLGWAMWAGRFIFIDRGNPAAARRSIDEAKRRIRGGESVLLFPEGTRSRDGTLGAFKKGGVYLAIDSGVPIVPVALMGTREAMPRGSLLLRSGHVRVTIGAPISTEGMTEADRDRILEQVHGAVAGMLNEASVKDAN